MDGKNNQEKEDKIKKPIMNLEPNNLQSPYHLCSSDSSSNIISPVMLNGNNYANWSRLTIKALKSKNKSGSLMGWFLDL